MRLNMNSLFAVGYVRVSSDVQAKHGESLAIQRSAIREQVKLLGLRLKRMYEDRGISGARAEGRPELQRLLADARKNGFQTLVVHRLSRLGRNTLDLHNIIAELQVYGVALVSIKEHLDLSSAAGRVLFTMLSAIAEFEREVMVEQMTENRVARIRRGEVYAGTPPQGYRWNRESKQLEIVPDEASVVRRIFQLYLEGHGFEDVAYLVHQEGLHSRSGGVIRPTHVRYILTNPIYVGRAEFIRNPVKGGLRRRHAGPDSEVITRPAPPIIGPEQWEKVRIEETYRQGHPTSPVLFSDYWLRNSLRCGLCGCKIVPKYWGYNRRKDGTFPRRYYCRWSAASYKKAIMRGLPKCKLSVLDADAIEDEVLHQLCGLIAGRRGYGWTLRESARLLSDDVQLLRLPERQVLLESLLAHPIVVQPCGPLPGQWELGPIEIVREPIAVEQRFTERQHLPIESSRMELLRNLAFRIVSLLWTRRARRRYRQLGAQQ
jgi:DNA invertase Pin-like site-specific DNA recombinase